MKPIAIIFLGGVALIATIVLGKIVQDVFKFGMIVWVDGRDFFTYSFVLWLVWREVKREWQK